MTKRFAVAIFLGVLLSAAPVALAAPFTIQQPTILPQTTDRFELGTSTAEWFRVFTKTLCLSGNCMSAWPSGGSGVGTSTEPFMASWFVGTSTLIASQFPYASSTALTLSGAFCFGGVCATGVTGTTGNIVLSGGGATFNANAVTLPVHRGGTAVGSTVQIEATTNAVPNSSSAVLFNYGAGAAFESARMQASTGNWGFGSTTPWAQLSASSTSANPALAVQQNSTGPAAIFSGGNFGIGTTSPATTLSVGGSGYITNGLGVGLLNTTAGTIQTSGNIALGTYNVENHTNPAQLLFGNYQSSGNPFPQFIFNGPANGMGLGQMAVSGNHLRIGAANWPANIGTTGTWPTFGATAFDLTIDGGLAVGANATAPTNGLLVSGNVGIGSTTPTNKLSVDSGSIDLNGNAGSYKQDNVTILTASSTTGVTYSGLLAGSAQLSTTTSDLGNTAFGYQAMQNATTSMHSTAFGYLALKGGALLSSQFDGDNTAFGWKAATANTSGHRVVAIGYQAGAGNTTANDSVYIGYNSGKGGNSSDSTCVGFNTCASNSFTGLANSAFGANALANVQGGTFNVAFGGGLFSLTSGSNNVSLGVNSLGSILTSSGNVAIGNNAGGGLRDTASNNIIIGFNAATTSSITGSRNIMIGHDIGPADPTLSNTLNIGNLLFGTGLTSEGTTTPAGNFGVSTTTPGSVFSIGNVANFTTATSTFYSTGGLNLMGGGCYAINGICIGGSGGSGTVTSITAATPNSSLLLSGTNPVTTSGTINFDLNLNHANTWTALQNFDHATTSAITATSSDVFLTGLTAGTGNGALCLTTAGQVQFSSAANCVAGGAGTPAGASTNIQTNSSGSFGATSGFSFDGTYLTVPGYINMSAPAFSNGAWIQFASSTFAFASTTNQATIFGLNAGGNSATTSVTNVHETAVGYGALQLQTTGDGNTAIGNAALALASTSPNNTAIGFGALWGSGTGIFSGTGKNTAVGFWALASTTSANSNTAIGWEAGTRLTTGLQNVFVGDVTAGQGIVTGNSNTLVGHSVARGMTSGASNSFFGALIANSAVLSGANNTAMGFSALLGINSGANNTAIGFQSGNTLNTGFNNSLFGYQSGFNITSGYDNIIIGDTQNTGGNNLTTGGGNILIGYNPLTESVSSSLRLSIGNSLFGVLPATSTATALNVPIGNSFGIGTSTPWGKFSIQTNNTDTFTNLFTIASSTASATTTLFRIDNIGHIYASSTNPVLSGCGTGPSMVGSDSWGEVTGGSTSAGCTVTFSHSYTQAPVCVVTPQTGSVTNTFSYTISSTAITVTETAFGTGKFDYQCFGVAQQ